MAKFISILVLLLSTQSSTGMAKTLGLAGLFSTSANDQGEINFFNDDEAFDKGAIPQEVLEKFLNGSSPEIEEIQGWMAGFAYLRNFPFPQSCALMASHPRGAGPVESTKILAIYLGLGEFEACFDRDRVYHNDNINYMRRMALDVSAVKEVDGSLQSLQQNHEQSWNVDWRLRKFAGEYILIGIQTDTEPKRILGAIVLTEKVYP